MNRSVVVKHLPAHSGRDICISDIHGNLDLYRKLLEKAGYVPGKDRLFLLGDLVEKGDRNLETVRYIMNQCQSENVHCLMGNCDFTAKNVLFSYRLDFLKQVISQRNSLIKEMAEAIVIDLSLPMDEYCQRIREHFLPELSFLASLPHVIVLPDRILTHAGIMDEENFGSDFRETMTYPLFMESGKTFARTVVCGHLPVSEYCRDIADFNPRHDAKANIWSIDGGNMVKASGQLNALIFAGNTVRTVSVDALPKGTANKNVASTVQIPFYVPFNHGNVLIKRQGEKESLVHSDYLKRDFWIHNQFLQADKGTDYTNWQMPLEKGEEVSIVCIYGDRLQVKRNGKLGWAWKEDIDRQD